MLLLNAPWPPSVTQVGKYRSGSRGRRQPYRNINQCENGAREGVGFFCVYVVEIEIDAAIMAHEKISQRIDSLHGEFQAVVRRDEPRILSLEEFVRFLRGPEMVLPVGVLRDAGLAGLGPVGREDFVGRVGPVVEDLVDDFGDDGVGGVGFAGVVGGGDLGLGEEEAGVFVEDVGEGGDAED